MIRTRISRSWDQLRFTCTLYWIFSKLKIYWTCVLLNRLFATDLQTFGPAEGFSQTLTPTWSIVGVCLRHYFRQQNQAELPPVNRNRDWTQPPRPVWWQGILYPGGLQQLQPGPWPRSRRPVQKRLKVGEERVCSGLSNVIHHPSCWSLSVCPCSWKLFDVILRWNKQTKCSVSLLVVPTDSESLTRAVTRRLAVCSSL